MNLFVAHPQQMDYRMPLFLLLDEYYNTSWFFFHKGNNSSNIKAQYGKAKPGSKLLTVSDALSLFKGIRNCDIFFGSFLVNPPYYTLVGLVIAKILHKKVIVWEEKSRFFKGIRHRIKDNIYRRVAGMVDAFFVLGQPQKQILLSIGVDSNSIFVANEYPGSIYSELPACPVPGFQLNGKRVILYLGRFIEVKGIPLLLDAFKRIEMQHDDVVLILVGSGHLEKDLKARAEELKIRNAIFTGSITELNKKKYLLEHSAMLVVPSIISEEHGCEGGPLVVLEALSAGTPVLGTDGLGSSTQFIVDGVNGYIVPHSDPDELYKKMQIMLECWKERTLVKERVLKSFSEINDHKYQFSQLQKAFKYVFSI